jgi:hypothetical protein
MVIPLHSAVSLEIAEVSFGCLEIKIIAEESHPEKF